MYQGQGLGILQDALHGIFGIQRHKLLPFFLKGTEPLQGLYIRFVIFHSTGRIKEIRSEYEEAIADYLKALELSPTEGETNWHIGRCYRKMGRYEEAETYLRARLKIIPSDPRARYDLALVLYETGRQEEAIEDLQMSLDIWKDADEAFRPAAEARATYELWHTMSLLLP